MKRITQTKEIKSGDDSGVVISGNERVAYSNTFTLDQYGDKDLVPYRTVADMIDSSTPPSSVVSVNGKQGVVVLTKSDIGLPNVDNTADIDKPISSAAQTALDGKAGLATNNVFTGTSNDFSSSSFISQIRPGSILTSDLPFTNSVNITNNGIGIKKGAFQAFIQLLNLTADRSVVVQDASGTLAYTVDIPAANTLIHTTGNETKSGRLSLITPNIAPGISNLNGVSPLVVQGGNGGNNTNTSGTVSAGSASNITVKAGKGGDVIGVTGTGISGMGGEIQIAAGDGGQAIGSGTLFPGNGGGLVLQAGTSYGGVAGNSELKPGNNQKAGLLGGNTYIVCGYGNNTPVDDNLYNGTIFLGVSASLNVRGNTVIGSITDDRTNRLQVTGNSIFNGNISANNLLSGTFTPTVVLDTNVSAANALPAHYMRVGNQVMVQGIVQISDAGTINALAIIYMSIPIASTFTNSDADLSGLSTYSALNSSSAQVTADTVNNRVKLTSYNIYANGNSNFCYSYTYTIK